MATLYDGKGNQISVDGGGTTPTPTPTPTTSSDKIYDKIIELNKVINLLDRTKSTKGRMQVPPTINPNIKQCEVSDYIEVMANNTYVAQVWDNQGLLGVEKIVRFDKEKNYLSDEEIVKQSNDGIHYVIYTPSEDSLIRFQYAVHVDNPNPMFFMGSSVSSEFVAYTGEEIDMSNYHHTLNSEFRNILLRDNLQNNLYGKTVYWFGDSNFDNWASGQQRKNFEKKFGCKVRSYGTYGATWGDATDGVNSTSLKNANGQWNKFLSEVEIDSSTYLFPKDSAFFFMMGTNSGTLGEMPSNGVGAITDESCTTDISAMNYILRRVRYYGRNQPIGVFIPWECSGAKKEALIAICEYYAIPYFDITTFVPPYTHTKGLIRQDGTTVQNDYFTDGGVHLSAYGWEKFRRVAENWMAYQV